MSDRIKYFNINWLTEEDGPGKRLALFLQSCPLDCAWCHSPHSQGAVSPLLYFDSMCLKCQKCVEVCLGNCHYFINNEHFINRKNCLQCGKCVEACPQSSSYKPGSALVLPTRETDVNSLFEEIEPQLDLLDFEGGITFSGGEPLNQADALTKLAILCKNKGYHTALETSGIVSLNAIQQIAPYIDTWLFGMRLTTGTNNFTSQFLYQKTKKALGLLTSLANTEIIVRIPAIEGFTDTPEYLDSVKSLIEKYNLSEIQVLRFNKNSSHYYLASGIQSSINFESLDGELAYKNIYNFFHYKIQYHE